MSYLLDRTLASQYVHKREKRLNVAKCNLTHGAASKLADIDHKVLQR